jgi:hypothetical protein
MRGFAFVSLLALAANVTATLDPAKTNTKGKIPSKPSCSRMSDAPVVTQVVLMILQQ